MAKRARMYVTVIDGKIDSMTDSSEMVLLADNQVPVTPNELAIIRICRGDLNYARNIIRDIEDRINKKTA
jgi:hypothetical protein